MGSAVLSPDGETLVFSMRETDLAANRGRTDLFTISLSADAPTPQRWHTDPESDSEPVFGADGAVYWLSGRSGEPQVWRSTLSGLPEQVTRVEDGISGFKFAGDRIVFWRDVNPDAPEIGTGAVYDDLFVRQWDTWTDGGFTRLFSVPIEGGLPVEIGAGLRGNVPTRPFGGADDVAVSPDGETVYFVLREATQGEAWSTNTDIYAAPVDGSAAPVNLTPGRLGYDRYPAISPDGTKLAWLAMDTPGSEASQSRIYVRDLATGRIDRIAEDWDRSADSLAWSERGTFLHVAAHEGWNTRLYAISLDGDVDEYDLFDGSLSFVGAQDGEVFFTHSSLTEPGDLYGYKNGDLKRLTGINAERLSEIELGTVHRFAFPGAEGERVYGYVVEPAGLERGQTAPTVLWSHGGPQGQWSNGWSSRWNPQAWAGAGYAIVAIDFHGSSGYSQEFTDSINNDWGGKPLVDLQLGLAAARERYPFLHQQEACAAGGSYGGYMMNWIAGQWPEEFACLINHAGLFDMRSFYYSTEELFFPEFDFSGPYYAREEAYERWNPVNYVTNWQSPMLVIHGLKDFRVPYTQGLMAFMAQERLGLDARLLIFEDENHWILKPANSLQWHSEIFRWLDEHIGPDAAK
jgi:dipeptidyl aminopeptidase/acylaminoacyl peptidase